MNQLAKLAPADAGEVLTLQRAAYLTEAQAHQDLNLPPLQQTLQDLAAELEDAQVLALGLRDANGRLVAAVRARNPTDAPGVAEIGRLTVVPDRQGQGLGTALLTALEDRLRNQTAEFRLFTGEHSHGNLRLYGRLGYAETGRQKTGAGYSVVHMAKASPRP